MGERELTRGPRDEVEASSACSIVLHVRDIWWRGELRRMAELEACDIDMMPRQTAAGQLQVTNCMRMQSLFRPLQASPSLTEHHEVEIDI